MGNMYDGEEHRRDVRLFKNFSLSFHLEDSVKKSDETSIKDISRGGLRFTSSRSLNVGDHLVFEIGIPYIAPKKLNLEGLIVSTKQVTSGLVYEIRVKFISMDDQTIELFDMIEKRNKGS